MGSSEAFLPRFRKSNGNASVAGIAYSLSRALLEAHQGSLDDRGAFRVLPANPRSVPSGGSWLGRSCWNLQQGLDLNIGQMHCHLIGQGHDG